VSENVCRISEEAKAPIQGELIRGVPGLNQWERVLSSSDCQKEMRRSVGRPDRKAFREVGPSSAKKLRGAAESLGLGCDQVSACSGDRKGRGGKRNWR